MQKNTVIIFLRLSRVVNVTPIVLYCVEMFEEMLVSTKNYAVFGK